MMINQCFDSLLPQEYIAQPSIRLGDVMAIDIAARERESGRDPFSRATERMNSAWWRPSSWSARRTRIARRIVRHSSINANRY